MAIDLWVTGDGKIFSCSNRWLQHWSRPVEPCRPCRGRAHYEFLERVIVLSSHLRNLRNLGTSLTPITYPEVPTDPQRILTALFKQTINFLRRIKLPYTHVWCVRACAHACACAAAAFDMRVRLLQMCRRPIAVATSVESVRACSNRVHPRGATATRAAAPRG